MDIDICIDRLLDGCGLKAKNSSLISDFMEFSFTLKKPGITFLIKYALDILVL